MKRSQVTFKASYQLLEDESLGRQEGYTLTEHKLSALSKKEQGKIFQSRRTTIEEKENSR